MIAKINIYPIIKGHFDSFKDRDGKYITGDLVGFFIIPLILALFLVWQGFQVIEKYINTAIIAETIFVPLLVNVLVVVYGLIDRIEKRKSERDDSKAGDKALLQTDNKKIELLRQLYANISYTILLSGLCLIALAIYSVQCFPGWLVAANRVLLYFLVINLLLTALMIMKRLHVLLENEFL
jgi:hypothetical protein